MELNHAVMSSSARWHAHTQVRTHLPKVTVPPWWQAIAHVEKEECVCESSIISSSSSSSSERVVLFTYKNLQRERDELQSSVTKLVRSKKCKGNEEPLGRWNTYEKTI